MVTKEYMREWVKKNPDKAAITKWKQYGLVGDYQAIYKRYEATKNCDLCGIELFGRGGNKKCMEHCHKTGEFRNVVCSRCNCAKTDRTKQKTNTTGYKNICYHKKDKTWVFRKQFKGKNIKVCRKNKIELLCIKFAAIILYRY